MNDLMNFNSHAFSVLVLMLHNMKKKFSDFLNKPTHLHFTFYFTFSKPAENNPPFFYFSCSIFTTMSVLIVENSTPLTSPTSSSSINLDLLPSPSLFGLKPQGP
jgi:hypothetical protein